MRASPVVPPPESTERRGEGRRACYLAAHDERAFPRTKAVAHRLRALREARGLSQGIVAREAGLNPSPVSNYETGKREVTLGIAIRLASALDVTFCQLIDLETDHLIVPAGSRPARAVEVLEESAELLEQVLDGARV